MQYENMIGLIGTLKQIEKIDEVNGLSFNGYKAIVTTERTSGAKDDAIVLITEETMRDNRTGLPKEGEAVMIAGSVQTHKNFGTGKVLVYALAAVMEIMTGTHWQYENEIKFTGKLGKGINYRATPNGRKITDIYATAALSMRAVRGASKDSTPQEIHKQEEHKRRKHNARLGQPRGVMSRLPQ